MKDFALSLKRLVMLLHVFGRGTSDILFKTVNELTLPYASNVISSHSLLVIITRDSPLQ